MFSPDFVQADICVAHLQMGAVLALQTKRGVCRPQRFRLRCSTTSVETLFAEKITGSKTTSSNGTDSNSTELYKL